jgi:hypothetical protein
MRLVNPESLEWAGIALFLSLRARVTSLHSFVLLVHRESGKLLLVPLLLRAHGITIA